MAEKGASRGASRRFWSLLRKRRGAPGRYKPGESGGMNGTSVRTQDEVPLGRHFLVVVQHFKILRTVLRTLKNI